VGEAEKRHNRYLLCWAANNMVLYGGRLIFLGWEIDLGQAGVEFTRNTEWNWRDGHPPLPDW